MKRCRDYVSRTPTFLEEAIALRLKAERYAGLAETVMSANLRDEICQCATDLKAQAAILEHVNSGGLAEQCSSCCKESCPGRDATLIKPLWLD
jgi:hypothetical protein